MNCVFPRLTDKKMTRPKGDDCKLLVYTCVYTHKYVHEGIYVHVVVQHIPVPQSEWQSQPWCGC